MNVHQYMYSMVSLEVRSGARTSRIGLRSTSSHILTLVRVPSTQLSFPSLTSVDIFLDSSVSGSRFGLSASPSLAHLARDAAKDIPHPTIPGRSLWQARLDSGPLFGLIDEEALRVYEEQHGLPILEAEDFAAENENGTQLLTASDELRAEVMGGKKIDMHGVPVHSAVTGVHPLGSGSDYTVFLQRIGVASANGGFGSTLSDPVYHYHSVFDSQTWQERFGDPGFHRHVS